MPLPVDRVGVIFALGVLLLASPIGAREKLPPPIPSSLDEPQGNGPRGSSQATPGEVRYDEVGYAGIVGNDSTAIVAAHRSLPHGSFVEVTSLATGKTILVLITGQAGGGGDRVIGLSPAAARMLAIDDRGPAGVRVRRVNPPGGDQQALREGRPASERIDSPPVLLTALRKQLPGGWRDTAPVPTRPILPRPVAVAPTAPTRFPRPEPGMVSNGESLFVQVAALSSSDRAESLAQSLGGSVQAAGRVFRVRMGPFGDAAAAQRARDAVARRGYADARIVREN